MQSWQMHFELPTFWKSRQVKASLWRPDILSSLPPCRVDFCWNTAEFNVKALSFLFGRNLRRREKIFNRDYGCALTQEQKKKIMGHARAWSAKHKMTGQHRGALTRSALKVLETLLWKFHNSRTGWCFPSYDTIAKEAEHARSVVADALKALEAAGILTWANHLVRVPWKGGIKLVRSSNSYAFCVPKDNLSPQHKTPKLAKTSKSGNRTETLNQDLSYTMVEEPIVDKPENEAVRAALKALALARTAEFNQEWLRERAAR